MNKLEISERCSGNITILDLTGRLIFGEESILLRNAIRHLLSEEKKKILLNFDQVEYIDSSGIGELVSGFTAITKDSGELKLLHLTKKNQDLLAIAKLLAVFDVYDNEIVALSSFN